MLTCYRVFGWVQRLVFDEPFRAIKGTLPEGEVVTASITVKQGGYGVIEEEEEEDSGGAKKKKKKTLNKVCLSACMSVCLPACLSLSVYLSVCLARSLCLAHSASMRVCLSRLSERMRRAMLCMRSEQSRWTGAKRCAS